MPPQAAASPAQKANWRGILDPIPAAAYICDAAGLITYFNPLAAAVWGRAPALRDPADRYCGSLKLYLPDGTPVRHEECWMALALLEDKPYNGREIVIERSDGGRTLGLAHANPLRDDQDRLIGAVNLVVDNTVPRGATLAMTEVAIALLAGMRWPASTFN
jgi:two-component system, LuxR family, sensor kinase FixL